MSQLNARLVYRNAYKQLVKSGVNPNRAILSQSYLRLEQVASTSKTSYQFGVLVNDTPGGSTVRATETRLNLQDAFYCATVQIFVSIADSATATDFVPQTYNNLHTFTTTGASAALMNFYNGNLSLTVNNRVITPTWDVLRHYEVPQTQQTAVPTTTANTVDQMTGGYSASFVCEPNWVLIGSKNNNLTITLPNSIGTLQAAKTTVLGVILRGVLAQNVTSVK
jgi:hypothetical protein